MPSKTPTIAMQLKLARTQTGHLSIPNVTVCRLIPPPFVPFDDGFFDARLLELADAKGTDAARLRRTISVLNRADPLLNGSKI